ncbi:MTH895/ArsE family thioredoxin-like protein [Archaeoglobus profundus]|uniref:Redox-active disulfide protein 2 n=1 Tax=Archaeoglobus profundus (strain DSM 5631 / JCM 9629 / NBRC 100127 / Av18) TaxID=572546 RepID=D2RHF6_ARCPA|nr:MTH895/ArsE family thioredoxin-like protein [Archaeoglobus profundus]ADB57731.1 redox-active disulfide protein 2 [Archaeoglobus profundus DSM 5631]
MKIKVVGPGCPRCKATYKIVKKVIDKEGLDAELEYVTDMNEAANLGVIATPAVWIDGEVVIQGKVPKESELLEIIKKEKKGEMIFYLLNKLKTRYFTPDK